MTRLRALASRVAVLFVARRRDATLDQEIAAHLDLLTEEHVRRGMPLREARAAARREFGGVDQMKESYRDQRGLPFVDTLTQDVRFGARTLRKAPGFTLLAVLVLALGIGVTTAIFSLIDAALLRPLPFRDAHQLVMLWEHSPNAEKSLVSMSNLFDWKAQNKTFASMGASVGIVLTPLADEKGGPPDAVALANVTSDFFSVLGVTPLVGRTFDAHDDLGSASMVVISERLWRDRFGADPRIVGRGIGLGSQGRLNTVVGIVPAGFQVLGAADVWQFTQLSPGIRGIQRAQRFARVMARLKPGTTIDQARADMAVVAANIERAQPATNNGWSVTVEPLQDAIVGQELRTTTLVLGGVVLFVLLLACANVANLVLARGVGRTRELAVRAAIGGTRARIARQLLTESALLGCLGGTTGLAVAWGLLRVAPSFIPPQTIPESIVIGIDWRLAVFAVAVTFMTALLFGLAPAWQAARVPLVEAMIGGARGPTDRAGRVRQALAVVEIAAAVLLMTGAGLLVRTLVSLNNVDAGYRAEHVATMTLRVPGGMLFREGQGVLARYFQSMEEEIGRVPGVRVAAIGSDVPLSGQSLTRSFEIAGETAQDPANRPGAHYQMITPSYFDALGIPLVRGRAFTSRDTSTTAPVAIVNEAFAQRYFPARDPIGARFTVDTMAIQLPAPVTREIVGVIRQVKTRPDEPTDNALEIYVPLAQNTWAITTVVVRAAGDPMRLMPSIRAAVARVDPLQIVSRVRTMEAVAAESTARPRFRAQLMTAFAALASVLAGVGVFSVFTFTVRQRTREFSIRMALGARSADVLRLVLGKAVNVVGAGLSIGIVAALGLARSMATLLFGVTPLDPVTFTGSAALLGSIALIACALPAVRAARSDPAVALRQE